MQQTRYIAHGTVGDGGQIVLPPEVLEAADFKPGDFVAYTLTGPNTIQLSFYHRLTLAEMLETYRIERPFDLEAEREAMYDEMAMDVFGSRRIPLPNSANRGTDNEQELASNSLMPQLSDEDGGEVPLRGTG